MFEYVAVPIGLIDAAAATLRKQGIIGPFYWPSGRGWTSSMDGTATQQLRRPGVRFLSKFLWCGGWFVGAYLAQPWIGWAEHALRQLGAFLLVNPDFVDPESTDPERQFGELVAGLLIVPLVILLAVLRRRYSHRIVARSVATGVRVDASAQTFMLSLALWAATLATQVLMAPGAAAREGYRPSHLDPEAYVAAWALWIALFVLGNWAHVRRYQIEPLDAAGVLVLRQDGAVTAGLPPFWRVYGIWVIGLRTTAIFAVGKWLSGEYDGTFSDFLAEYAFDNSLTPMFFAVLCLGVLFVVPRWRPAGREVLAHPRTRWCLSALVLGIVLHFVWAPVGDTVAWVASTAIAATSLQLMDLGPQPWIGGIFLLIQWNIGLTMDGTLSLERGDVTIPESFWSWGALVCGTWSAFDGVRKHVMAHLGVQAPDDPDRIGGAAGG